MKAALISYSANDRARTGCPLDMLKTAQSAASRAPTRRRRASAKAGVAPTAGAPFRGSFRVNKMRHSKCVGQLEQEAAPGLRYRIEPQIGEGGRGGVGVFRVEQGVDAERNRQGLRQVRVAQNQICHPFSPNPPPRPTPPPPPPPPH